MDDSQRREILKQIDEITKRIWERHHEETRQQIYQQYEELYRRIKELRDDDAGQSSPQSKLRLDHVLMWFRARVQSEHPLEAGRRKASRTQRQVRPRR